MNMYSNIYNKVVKAAGAMAIPVCIGLASCTAEPDDSNMYTFTGQTIEDFLVANDTAFSSFNYILSRVGYDKLLDSYGTYTCFAPNNQAVSKYIDSLYNDEVNIKIPHNGMTENSLEGLSDSLCLDIAKFHLANSVYQTINLGTSSQQVLTMLNRGIMTSINSNGQVVLNDGAAIDDKAKDIELENGYLHVINSVIPRSNRLNSSEIQKLGKYALFEQALLLTGLKDSIDLDKKDVTLDLPAEIDGYYTPKECRLGFTIFAEPDEVLNKYYNIFNIEDLIAHAKDWYENAAKGDKATADAGWYDYYRNNHVEISTGNDYTSPYNVLNMYVRYHILKAAVMPYTLTIEYNVTNGYGYNMDTYDYYETMLPKTLLKVWKVKKEGKIYINRYQTNNTLTDQLEGMGSDAMHEVVDPGITIDVENVAQSANGYIYPIDKVLIYNSAVPQKVLNERLRFDVLSMLSETMNNGFRGIPKKDLANIAGKSCDRLRYPINYFDNVKVYNGHLTKLDMNVRDNDDASNSYVLYKGDSFQGMGSYDLAIKLPPVPDGEYELRVDVTTFGVQKGSMLQYYLGKSSNLSDMQAVDIPIDMRISAAQPTTPTEEIDQRLKSIGYCSLIANGSEDDYADKGLTSDKEMRTHGWMRGPLSVCKIGQPSFNSRFAAYQLRRILKKDKFTQGDYWLRMKTVLPEVTEGKYQIDVVEFVPINVYQNSQYLEDMY